MLGEGWFLPLPGELSARVPGHLLVAGCGFRAVTTSRRHAARTGPAIASLRHGGLSAGCRKDALESSTNISALALSTCTVAHRDACWQGAPIR